MNAHDSITAAMRSKIAEAAELRRRAELLDAEARGIKIALAMLPRELAMDSIESAGFDRAAGLDDDSGEADPAAPRGGRQPGALSTKWKRNLILLGEAGGAFGIPSVIELVGRLDSRVIRPAEARRLLEGYVQHGHIRRVGADRYEVPDDTIAKFRAALGQDDLERPETKEAADVNPSPEPSAASETPAEAVKPAGEVAHDNMM